MAPTGTLQKPWENKGLLQGRRRKSKGLLGATSKILRLNKSLQTPLVKQGFGQGHQMAREEQTGPPAALLTVKQIPQRVRYFGCIWKPLAKQAKSTGGCAYPTYYRITPSPAKRGWQERKQPGIWCSWSCRDKHPRAGPAPLGHAARPWRPHPGVPAQARLTPRPPPAGAALQRPSYDMDSACQCFP